VLERVRTAIYGASGYAGAELLRLCAGHPHFEVVGVAGDTLAGQRVADVYPSLAAAYGDMAYSSAGDMGAGADEGIDVAFLALPHGTSQQLVPELRHQVKLVVDLGADFRLRDPGLYPAWYGAAHSCPELLADSSYGIPELFRPGLVGASLIASAGCYVTAAALALAPLVRAGVVRPEGVVVDAASGVSGAGRGLKPSNHFNAVDEDFSAYGLLSHRHTPEIEQATGAQVIFTPHLAPMNRGILVTVYARPAVADPAPLEVLAGAYAGERFVVVSERSPSTKATLGSNCAHLTARHDGRTGWVIALCALDNLTKGAAGQAIQCANVALGLDEGAGLPTAGLYP
jgi:N-acetyl-gamma-glutamyl-phosphate reductase